MTRVIERTERGDDENATATDVDDLTRAMDGVRLEEKITEEDFEVACKRVRAPLREVAIEIPNVRWDDVGGLDDVKCRLKEAVEWAEKPPRRDETRRRLAAQGRLALRTARLQ